MSSDDSDDEPLSILAATKRLNTEKFEIKKVKSNDADSKKKKKKAINRNSLSLTIKLGQNDNENKVIERPSDVWLYMKDLNISGPYSCLLCTGWFINRTKMIVHYITNHKKDFCGICRYFVADREAWANHLTFHIPWSCSQCTESFQTEIEMRHHLSAIHNLVHCRLCHFRVSDDDQYNAHLFQKHNVTNICSKTEDILWEHEYDGSPKFFCILCSKPNNLSINFFNHYMGYHRFTLKCFSSIISGRDIPFSVDGADVSSQFVDGELNQMRYGYMDLDKKSQESFDTDGGDSNNMINALIPEIKQEITSENEEPKTEKNEPEQKENDDLSETYLGDEDFDITSMELIVLQKSYFDYIDQIINQINGKVFPEESTIDYENEKSETTMKIFCSLCKTNIDTVQAYTIHMRKMHLVKTEPMFTCRVCATTFNTYNELESHAYEELKEFDDLWICQFCEKEFDNREETRRHLNEHWDVLEYDNCFSPHLGFKCKYCPTLFWNETDRRTHEIRVHSSQHKEDCYKCESCSEVFSDNVWFIHHYIERHQGENDNTKYIFKCCLCSLVIPTVEDMRNHFTAHHPEARKIFCSLGSCNYRPFSHRKSFKIHVRSVHNRESMQQERSSTCIICGRDFATARACSTHMTQVHGPGKFKCKLCREVMYTSDERKLHYLIRHPGRHPFSCTECGKSFQHKSSLYMHKQEHRPNQQSYTCNYCGKTFMKKDSFREHIQIHEGPRHACSYCPKRFVQRSNMLRHERRHTGERPYGCPHCPRTFSDKGACTAHSRTHTKDRSYACLYCGQTFVQKSKLTYHIRKHTGENLETCSVCSKLFTSACSLREHMKTHVVKKDTVPCPLCGRKYQDERYMMRHLRTVHAGTRYNCPLCRKSLTSAAGLRHHVITHSDINMFRCKLCPKSYAVKRTLVKHLRRRHYLKGVNSVLKDFVQILDPRDCNLGLDDDVMNDIFGPPKKKSSDVLLANFVTLQKLAEENKKNGAVDRDGEGDETDDGDERDDETEDEKGEETTDHFVVELEPTDFVSVKIEPMDAEDDEVD
ncbi:unnamed protein product [Diatraea saccharalis]|uniref:C2H2-type domain-containing protein n=1 Tax=Diatraea saccharalis TaxID=40085 RepID=A0A9N9R072_9NEOP|nr:unnamed protein product [Diatraea saccharalis]